jgi:hypothetical protein
MRLPKLSILGLCAVIAAVAGAQTFSSNNPSVLTVGAPFQGDWVGRSERTLADGTVVVHEVHGRVARDSQGRFRQEEEAGADPGVKGAGGTGAAGTSANQDIRYIVIDPVSHTQVRWSSTSKDATLLPSGGENLRIPFPFPLLGWPATRSALDQPQPGAAADMITITDLGQKTTDGLVTEGTRTTTIVPAGKLGNDRPLTIVQDVWISRILNLVVLDTVDDPLVGKQTFEIKNITRTEPAAALFTLPDGYQTRQFPGLNAAVLGAVLPPAAPPTPATLSNLRPVQGVVPDRQNYVVLDEGIWVHARRDLADLRLFAGNTEVPYKLTLERSSESAQKSEVKLLNVGPLNAGRPRAAGSGAASGAEFVIDMAGVTVYDGVELRLADSAKNFVARASVQGLRAASDALGTDLGGSVIYDLSNEGLGADFTVKFRQATFPFLRVRVAEISPDQVMRAIAIDSSAQAGGWTPVSPTLPIEQAGRTTVVTWSANAGVPVSRVVLSVDPSQTNFWRDIEVLTPNGGTVTNTSVHRVHMARDGNVAESDSLAIDLPYEAWGGFQIVIENGDEPPLKISAAKGYFYERRMYFDPHGSTSISLYSGNARLGTPSYEYSRLFHADENAAVATLGLDVQNSNYRGRLVPQQPPQ